MFRWITYNVKSKSKYSALLLSNTTPSEAISVRSPLHTQVQGVQSPNRPQMTVARRSRCEADSQCAVAPQHTSPSGSRELEYAGPISFSTYCAQCLGQRSLSLHQLVFLQPHELLITQQAQYVGIPDAGITQSKMASDNAGLAWHNETRQRPSKSFQCR